MSQHFQHDVVVIGSGAAGLTLALQLDRHLDVAVICKGSMNQGATYYAQGGIAAVLDDDDSIEAHVEDTLNAGGGLCHQDAVNFTVENSRDMIDWLVKNGVEFSRNPDS